MARNLDLDLIRTFVSSADEGSFARAADKLSLAAPTVSLQMKRLEEQTGADLFYKDGRQKGLTEVGKRFLSHSRKLLQMNDLALSECKDLAVSGRIRIGTTQDFAEDRLLFLLKEMMEFHSKLQVELTVDLNRRIHAALERRELDVAIAAVDPLGRSDGEILCRERLVWIGAEGLTIASEQPVPLVLFHDPCIVRDIVLQQLNEADRAWRIACTSPSLSGLMAATKAGFGLTARTPDQLERGLTDFSGLSSLPALPEIEIALFVAPGQGEHSKLVAHVCKVLRGALFGR